MQVRRSGSHWHSVRAGQTGASGSHVVLHKHPPKIGGQTHTSPRSQSRPAGSHDVSHVQRPAGGPRHMSPPAHAGSQTQF